MVSEKSKRTIWLLWALIWPVSVCFILVRSSPLPKESYLSVTLMAIMLIGIALFYFQVGDTDIFVIQSVSMTVFLLFGLAVELILTQLGVIAYIASKRQTKDYLYRYPVNMLMFLIVSVLPAGFFYLIGGHIGVLQPGHSPQIIQIIGYGLMAFLVNHLASFLLGVAFYGDKDFLGKDALWEFVTTLLTMPISFIFYILYSQYGVPSILIIFIPMMTLSVIFRLISRGSLLNRQLRLTTEIGRELSQTLETKSVFQQFFGSLQRVLEVSTIFLFSLNEEGLIKSIHQFNENGEKTSDLNAAMLIPETSFMEEKRIVLKNKSKWPTFLHHLLPKSTQSVMTLPISMNNQEAIILIGNKLKYGYHKQHQMLFEIMTHFFSVATKNAANYEKTKMESERDPLTHLYNYRYFTNLLQANYVSDRTTPFTIIMIDLDHFKSINDEYGHEAGNDILIQMAHRLTTALEGKGIAARYGGEEFIILLENMTLDTAYPFAESLRKSICDIPFKLNETLSDRNETLLQITASMGIATGPEQGEDPLTLIRNADRAMYSGAKQKGRNRVATYSI